MNITSVKTPLITKPQQIEDIISSAIDSLPNKSVVAVSSKVVAICQGRITDKGDKQSLVRQESEKYLYPDKRFGYTFTLKNRTLSGAAGVDQSNTKSEWSLLPNRPIQTAETIRKHLQDKFSINDVGVIIVDSTSFPLRRGTVGVCLGHSGFSALNNYIGSSDLFGRTIKVSQASPASSLSSVAVYSMGEGAEQTPLCVISDIPHITFQNRPPTQQEVDEYYLKPENDIFARFWNNVEWHSGGAQDELDKTDNEAAH